MVVPSVHTVNWGLGIRYTQAIINTIILPIDPMPNGMPCHLHHVPINKTFYTIEMKLNGMIAGERAHVEEKKNGTQAKTKRTRKTKCMSNKPNLFACAAINVVHTDGTDDVVEYAFCEWARSRARAHVCVKRCNDDIPWTWWKYPCSAYTYMSISYSVFVIHLWFVITQLPMGFWWRYSVFCCRCYGNG